MNLLGVTAIQAADLPVDAPTETLAGIHRPSGLFGAPAVTDYQVTGGFVSGRFTSRTDLADCMLRQLDDNQNVHKVLAVATISGRSSFLKLFLPEGIGKKAA